jgi:hypothetical protein
MLLPNLPIRNAMDGSSILFAPSSITKHFHVMNFLVRERIPIKRKNAITQNNTFKKLIRLEGETKSLYRG